MVALAGLSALAALFTAPFADPPTTASIIPSSAAPVQAAVAAEHSGSGPAAGVERRAPASQPEPVTAPGSAAAQAPAQPEAEALEPDDPRWARTHATDPAGGAGATVLPAPAPTGTEPGAPPPADVTGLPGSILAAPVQPETSPEDGQAAPEETAPPDDTETAAIPPAEPAIEAVKPAPRKKTVARPATSGAPPSSNVAVTSAVKMRTRPAKGAAVVTVVPDNATVGLVNCGAWCEVVYKGRRGFIYKGFIDGRGVAARKAQPQAAANEPSKPKVERPSLVDLNSIGR